MRWENAIEKLKNAIQMWVQARKRSNAVNSMGKLGAPDTENVSKWQSNDTQGAGMHSRLLSTKLINLIKFHRSSPCFAEE